MNTIAEFRKALEQRRGRQMQIKDTLKETNLALRNLRRERRNIEQAQVVIQTVAQQTQQELQYKINEMVSMALAAVFPDPYKFEVEFTIARGKTEANLWFVRNGEKLHPLSSTGGGAVDVACFALRVALWKLSTPKLRNVLILDEPFKHLSIDMQPLAAEMLHRISEALKLQIIMVSHVEDLIEEADCVFEVRQRNGVSRVVSSTTSPNVSEN